MANREVHIEIENLTGSTLQLQTKTNLKHGEWTITPVNVPNDTLAKFQADSFGAGVEGTIYYKIKGDIDITLFFDNPLIGTNSYDGRSSDPNIRVITEGTHGNHATVKYTLQQSASKFIN